MNPKTGEVSDTPVGMMEVYQEFSELSEKFKIMKFKSKVRSLREGSAQLLQSRKMRQMTKKKLTGARFAFSVESREALRL